jgi:hypothetical protein
MTVELMRYTCYLLIGYFVVLARTVETMNVYANNEHDESNGQPYSTT